MKVFCERCGNAHDESICCKSYANLPPAERADSERSAYAQLPEVRNLLREIKATAIAIPSDSIQDRIFNLIENYETGKPLLHNINRRRI